MALMEDILTEIFMTCDRNRDCEVRNSLLWDYADNRYGDDEEVMVRILFSVFRIISLVVKCLD